MRIFSFVPTPFQNGRHKPPHKGACVGGLPSHQKFLCGGKSFPRSLTPSGKVWGFIFAFFPALLVYIITPNMSYGMLEISSRDECESLGGIWNECPKNECQKSEEYEKGTIVCPQVCGSPTCEGIVPTEDDDLSEIHNPVIDHNPIFRGNGNGEESDNTKKQDKKESENAPTVPQAITQEPNTASTSVNENIIAAILATGLLILLIFFFKTYRKQ